METTGSTHSDTGPHDFIWLGEGSRQQMYMLSAVLSAWQRVSPVETSLGELNGKLQRDENFLCDSLEMRGGHGPGKGDDTVLASGCQQ